MNHMEHLTYVTLLSSNPLSLSCSSYNISNQAAESGNSLHFQFNTKNENKRIELCPFTVWTLFPIHPTLNNPNVSIWLQVDIISTLVL